MNQDMPALLDLTRRGSAAPSDFDLPSASGPASDGAARRWERGKGRRKTSAGFTLLEVMIAVGVLGIAMLSLLSLHDSNLQSVMRGQELSTASALAQGLMADAEMERFPMIATTSGDFDRLFPGWYRNFKWQRSVEASGMFPDIRKVQVTIYYGPRFRKQFSLVEFLHDPAPQILPGQAQQGGGIGLPSGANSQPAPNPFGRN